MSQIKNNPNFLGMERRKEDWPDGQNSDCSGDPKKFSAAPNTAAAKYDPKVEPKRKNREHLFEYKISINI